MSAFSSMVTLLRTKKKWSQNELARRTSINPAYVNRMEKAVGGCIPTKGIVEGLAEALELSEYERDGLLVASGYCPKAIEQLGVWDTTLAAVADVLRDQSIPEWERNEYAFIVRALSARWSRRND